jgi:hypothetical protein
MLKKLTHGADKPDATGMRRRDFILASGAAVATAAVGALGLPTRLYAQSGRTEITFASARFFSTDTMQQVIESYNKSQNSVHVSYIELPPTEQLYRSSSATRSATCPQKRLTRRLYTGHHLDCRIRGSRLGAAARPLFWRG